MVRARRVYKEFTKKTHKKRSKRSNCMQHASRFFASLLTLCWLLGYTRSVPIFIVAFLFLTKWLAEKENTEMYKRRMFAENVRAPRNGYLVIWLFSHLALQAPRRAQKALQGACKFICLLIVDVFYLQNWNASVSARSMFLFLFLFVVLVEKRTIKMIVGKLYVRKLTDCSHCLSVCLSLFLFLTFSLLRWIQGTDTIANGIYPVCKHTIVENGIKYPTGRKIKRQNLHLEWPNGKNGKHGNRSARCWQPQELQELHWN